MKFGKSFCGILIAFCSLPLFAKPIEFPVSGLFTCEPEPIPTFIDWDETEFGRHPSTVYNHSLARIACLLSEVSYLNIHGSYAWARTKTYTLMGVKEEDIEYHYDLDYRDPQWGFDQCAFSLAKKDIAFPNGKRTIVFLTIRGTPAEASEWISNFDIGNDRKEGDVLHQGFLKVSMQIESALYIYLIKHQIQPSQAYFMITGHSRGAAVANLLAANLSHNQQFDTNDMYVYTFATPNVTTDKNAHSSEYDFIWNIVNAEDIIPTIPLNREKWEYHKYGRTRTLVNYWNVGQEKYDTYYYPKMNEYYRSFLKRDYTPFRIGPFIPIQVTRFLVRFYSTVGKYYGKVLGLHNKVSALFLKMFPIDDDEGEENSEVQEVSVEEEPEEKEPEPPQEEKEEKKKKKTFGENIIDWMNNYTGGLIDFASEAFVDMHANENYLAWMLAFDEDEVFSDLGSAQLLVRGNFEAAVFDSEGKVVARFKDSRILYRTINAPIASVQLRGTEVTIGFPANVDFTVVICRDSIIPSSVSVQIEQYDAAGVYLGKSKKQYIGPHRGIAYKVKGGTVLLDATAADIEKVKGEERASLVKAGNLNHAWDFSIVPEVNINTYGSFGAGIHVGTQMVYATGLVNTNPYKFTRSLMLISGAGTQQNLFGPLMLDVEGYFKFIWIFDEGVDTLVNYVPSLRLSLAYKPRHRFQIFAGAVFDFHIDGMNDRAFESDIIPQKIGAISFGDSVEAIPCIQFGVRF